MARKIHLEGNFRKTELAAAIVIVVILFFMVSWAIIAHTDVRNLIPGYPDEEDRIEAQENAIKLDSLERCLYRWELYTKNLRNILEGAKPIRIDSLVRQADREMELKETGNLAKSDSTLRAKITEVEKNAGTGESGKKEVIEGIHFFKPIEGVIIDQFDPVQHPFIEVSAPEASPVKSVLDGNVIYTNWSDEDEWCIIVQHSDEIVSIYRHNHSLVKKAGDAVNAGTVIAVLGNGEDKVSYMGFELWENGVPVDPAKYITF